MLERDRTLLRRLGPKNCPAKSRWRALEEITMKNIRQIQVVSLLAGLLFALSSLAGETNQPVSLQQKKLDLLAGISKGICYSGFRHGQHPDRGDGAVNPSEKEILVVAPRRDAGARAGFYFVHTYPEWEKKDIDQAMPYTIANLQ